MFPFPERVPPTVPYTTHENETTKIVTADGIVFTLSRQVPLLYNYRVKEMLEHQANLKDLVFAVSSLIPQPRGLAGLSSRLWPDSVSNQSTIATRQLDVIIRAVAKLEADPGLMDQVLRIRDPGRSTYFGCAPPSNPCLSILSSENVGKMLQIGRLLDYSKVEMEKLLDVIKSNLAQVSGDFSMITDLLQHLSVLFEHLIFLRAGTNHCLAILAGYPDELEGNLKHEFYLALTGVKPPQDNQLGFSDLLAILNRIDSRDLYDQFSMPDGEVTPKGKALSDAVRRLDNLRRILEIFSEVENVLVTPQGFEAFFLKGHEADFQPDMIVQHAFNELVDSMGLLGYGRVLAAQLSQATSEADREVD